MSALEQELEEGEITDSDSMGAEEQTLPQPAKPTALHYSIFDNKPRSASFKKLDPRLHHTTHSDSDYSNSDNNDGDDDDDCDVSSLKRQKVGGNSTDSGQSKPFVNPNYVSNGGAMPSLPKQTNRTIWGSVLQEQILTAQVGNFSMEKKMSDYRDVESYDFTRAKDDVRPRLADCEVKNEEDLFGEVIDLEKVTNKQKRTLKRKHVSNRLGKRHSVKDRLTIPKVTENSSTEDVTFYISDRLNESKVHLIRRVVQGIGKAKALNLLRETEEKEASGGMMVMNGSRRRTPGGVYLTLLKTSQEVTKEQVDYVFEEDNRLAMELKKRKKARGRRRKHERDGQQRSTETNKDNNASSMDVVEDHNSRSSVEGQTGSPKNPADHLSDTQESFGPREQQDSNPSHSEDDNDNKSSSDDDFQKRLAQEMERQAKEKVKDSEVDNDITLDDVLDLCVDEEFID